MDRSNLRLAAKLVAKAQDTDFDAESAALAEKAYRLLAEFLNAYEAESATADGARRRERRQLRDRRVTRRVLSWWVPGGTDPATNYSRRADGTSTTGEGDIDLMA